MGSIDQLEKEYKAEGAHQRLGQFFCNKYVKYSWPELFYEEDPSKAVKAITIYLTHYQYIDTLPLPIKRG